MTDKNIKDMENTGDSTVQDRYKFKHKHNQITKIIIPIFIIIAILGIWIIKNKNKPPIAISENPDFSLNATEEFDVEKLKYYNLPIILDFGADYCPPCREMAPILVKLNQDLQEKAIIKYIDIEEFPELAKDYPISVIPTQMFFDMEGKPYSPSDPKALDMIIYTLKDTGEHIFTAHEGILTEEVALVVLKEMGMKE